MRKILLALFVWALFFAEGPAVDLPKIPKLGDVKNKSLLDTVNQSLARQQVKDGQFQFKTGTAEFAGGNEKRVNGLLQIITQNSNTLKSTFPNLHVVAEGHTDATGSADANQKLSLARAQTVCAALSKKGMKLSCQPTGVGSSKPLVTPERTPADKQKNRRVLVQMGK
jgi:outer membrane protein OmpA-like peptidoglycan-associated protein